MSGDASDEQVLSTDGWGDSLLKAADGPAVMLPDGRFVRNPVYSVLGASITGG